MLILGSLLALAQAVPAAGARPPAEPRAGQCAAVAVSSPEAPRQRSSFSARQVLDLQLGALLRTRPAGEHVLNLRVYTPKGHLYQQIDVPFRGGALTTEAASASAAATATPRLRRVDGYPQPLVEQEATPARLPSGQRGYQVSARLPVAGTAITTSSLYGKWKVVPHLDGAQAACGRGTTFAITQ
jgi:hypothetical protein